MCFLTNCRISSAFNSEHGVFLLETASKAMPIKNIVTCFSDRSCLELGCGSGMVGLCAARAGAAHVWLTDGNPDAVANCAFNCRLNGITDLQQCSDLTHLEGSLKQVTSMQDQTNCKYKLSAATLHNTGSSSLLFSH